MSEFEPFGKLHRLFRDCLITEKLDGTNAQVHVLEDGQVLAGSRTRYVTPGDDNFGWARWVAQHKAELRALGPGRHFGEWWGCGIQRNYHLSERRFSLFNVKRWADAPERPACCGVVPLLYQGPFSQEVVLARLAELKSDGSVAAPGFMDPEGIVVFHQASQTGFKVTLPNDGHKGQA